MYIYIYTHTYMLHAHNTHTYPYTPLFYCSFQGLARIDEKCHTSRNSISHTYIIHVTESNNSSLVYG